MEERQMYGSENYFIPVNENLLRENLMITGEISLSIKTDQDILTARQKTSWFAQELGFTGSWPIILSTIISELARNILHYTKRSFICIKSIQEGNKRGISITAINDNPEISEIEAASCRDFLKKYQTNTGKKAAKKFVDVFRIAFGFSNEIKVELIKWL